MLRHATRRFLICRSARTLVAAWIGVAVLGCVRDARQSPNVLLVVIDTLRADRLGSYGNRDGLTPFLDELAARATVFQRAYAQAPWTMPSIASLWTSQLPSQHGVIGFESVLEGGAFTLAEGLRGAGYATGGFSANGLIAAQSGFGQGFDVLDTADVIDGVPPPRADAIAARALGWLDALLAAPRRSAFLYVHFMEAHQPYVPPADLVASVFPTGTHPDFDAVISQMKIANVFPQPPEVISTFEALYDIEVRSIDRELRRLFAALETRGFLRDSLVIVTADHGEELGEHGIFGHGETLFEHAIRVPLLVVTPGQTERRDVAEPVALIDLMPTVLAWAGAAMPTGLMGQPLPGAGPASPPSSRIDLDLASRLRAGAAPDRWIVSELLAISMQGARPKVAHQRAIVGSAGKLVVGASGERAWYDLVADPDEHRPDGLSEPERAVLSRRLETCLARIRSRGIGPSSVSTIDESTRARMRALGYAD